jgi:hypothetical protein
MSIQTVRCVWHLIIKKSCDWSIPKIITSFDFLFILSFFYSYRKAKKISLFWTFYSFSVSELLCDGNQERNYPYSQNSRIFNGPRAVTITTEGRNIFLQKSLEYSVLIFLRILRWSLKIAANGRKTLTGIHPSLTYCAIFFIA